tara:strand:- start:100 stop:504 length:405 start_codon:yes stop_codon:yes gene_type:complete
MKYNIKPSPILAFKQGLSDEEFDDLSLLYLDMTKVFNAMQDCDPLTEDGVSALIEFAKEVSALEVKMQLQWKFIKRSDFDSDALFDKQCSKWMSYWFIEPHCECPTRDNNERVGTGYFIINGGCPIHGGYNNEN